MKLKILIIILFIIHPELTAQKITNSQCKWQKNEVDPFTRIKQRTTEWERVGFNNIMNNNIHGNVKFAVSEQISENDTIFTLWINTFTGENVCFNDQSVVLIKSGETIIDFPLLAGINCGNSLVNYSVISPADMEFLKKNPIDLLRIQFSGDGNLIINFDIKNVNRYSKLTTDYFIRTLKCFD
ncbi:MAG: hypothetical protein WAW07_09695 [Bacteroidales bacterium]